MNHVQGYDLCNEPVSLFDSQGLTMSSRRTADRLSFHALVLARLAKNMTASLNARGQIRFTCYAGVPGHALLLLPALRRRPRRRSLCQGVLASSCAQAVCVPSYATCVYKRRWPLRPRSAGSIGLSRSMAKQRPHDRAKCLNNGSAGRGAARGAHGMDRCACRPGRGVAIRAR